VGDPLETACFPLAPFTNRIAFGRFEFLGRRIQLEPAPGEEHALHGQAWRRPWRLIERGSQAAVLAYEHRANDGGWPWAYRVSQTLRLEDDRLALGLELTNLDTQPMPAGLGFHPYFPIDPSARLQACVSGAWLTESSLLPASLGPAAALGDWATGVDLPSPAQLDNCLTGWDRTARIDLASERIELHGSEDLRWLQVYAPLGEAFFCAEPVSHRADAVNAPDPFAEGLRILRPGETWTVTMAIGMRARPIVRQETALDHAP
jgi:aldose 1-epimerase